MADRPYVSRLSIVQCNQCPDVLFKANGACLGQDLLEGVLRKQLAKYGVSVELNRGLVALEQNTDAVTATVAVHQGGQPTDEKETVVAK